MSQIKNPESHSGRTPNRLINEQSPYLRQHAYNPVDWYAWGPDALERARTENKPIMLSIGYSACHWCHVMERESFENDAIARLINENFIPIKVDREERPDLDQIYMDAVQLITGRGGWPLTMFLAPDGRPFFGGTYYPPEDRQGMPGFPRILVAVSQAYRDKAKEVTNNLEKLTEALGAITNYVPTGGDLKPDPGATRRWHDTIPLPPFQTVFLVMSFDAKQQIGRFVFHCHILKHEDVGLMAPIEVWEPQVVSQLK